MGRLFENFEGYDVQEVRRQTREEDLVKFIQSIRDLGHTEEAAVSQLMQYYKMTETEAQEKVKLYW